MDHLSIFEDPPISDEHFDAPAIVGNEHNDPAGRGKENASSTPAQQRNIKRSRSEADAEGHGQAKRARTEHRKQSMKNCDSPKNTAELQEQAATLADAAVAGGTLEAADVLELYGAANNGGMEGAFTSVTTPTRGREHLSGVVSALEKALAKAEAR